MGDGGRDIDQSYIGPSLNPRYRDIAIREGPRSVRSSTCCRSRRPHPFDNPFNVRGAVQDYESTL
jgi:hypothetical protein